MIFQSLFFALCAYLLGSVPFGKLIAGAIARIDITQHGSGNIGATNVARKLSIKWGLITLILDMLKGFLPVVLFGFSASKSGTGYEFALSFVGLCALLGHQFSIFLRFRGGKGVGTALGVYLAISPLSCLAALAVFVLFVFFWDFISLGSIASAFAMPLFLALFGKAPPLVIGGLIIAVLIFFKHKENIQRLARGEERKWRGDRNQVSRSRSLSSSSSE